MYDRLSASGAQSSAQDAARTAGWTAEDCAHGWARAKASSEAVRTGWALSSSYDSGIGQGFRDLRTTIKGGERGSRSERVSIGATPSAGLLSATPFGNRCRRSVGLTPSTSTPETACRLRGLPRRVWGVVSGSSCRGGNMFTHFCARPAGRSVLPPRRSAPARPGGRRPGRRRKQGN